MHRRQQHRHARAMQRFHDLIKLCGTVRQMAHQRRIAGRDRRHVQPLPPLHQPGEVQLAFTQQALAVRQRYRMPVAKAALRPASPQPPAHRQPQAIVHAPQQGTRQAVAHPGTGSR